MGRCLQLGEGMAVHLCWSALVGLGWTACKDAAMQDRMGRSRRGCTCCGARHSLLIAAVFMLLCCGALCLCAAVLQRIQVHLLTGDNKATAHAIARELAIPSAQVRVCVQA